MRLWPRLRITKHDQNKSSLGEQINIPWSIHKNWLLQRSSKNRLRRASLHRSGEGRAQTGRSRDLFLFPHFWFYQLRLQMSVCSDFSEDLAICKLKCISERNESVCICSSHTEILRVPCFPKAAWDLALWEATRAASHLQGLPARVATGEDTFNCLKERIQPHHSANSPCQLFHGQTMLWKKNPSPALEGKCNASCQVDGKRIMQLAQTLHFW